MPGRRQRFCTAVLSPEEVYEGFVDLLDIAPIEAESFLEYLLDNYVRDDSRFSTNVGKINK